MANLVTKPLGLLLLAIYLILVGVLGLIGGPVISAHTAMCILAMAAGICILLGK